MNILHHLAQAAPHSSRMRDRKRKLKPIKPSHKNELWYRGQLVAIANALAAETASSLLPVLKMHEAQITGSADGFRIGDESPKSSIDNTIDQMAKRFGSIQQNAARLAKLAAERNKGAVDDRLKASILNSMKIDIGPFLNSTPAIQEAMAAAIADNVGLIRSIPEQYFGRIQKAVSEALVQGDRYEAMAARILNIKGMTQRRAKLIARDQTAKMNSSFNQIRQTGLGISRYRWQTSADERVRETHQANEGQIFRWDEPPATTGHPGEDIQCRCVAIPIFDLDEAKQ